MAVLGVTVPGGVWPGGVPAQRLPFLPGGHAGRDAEVTQCLDVWTGFQAEGLLCCS